MDKSACPSYKDGVYHSSGRMMLADALYAGIMPHSFIFVGGTHQLCHRKQVVNPGYVMLRYKQSWIELWLALLLIGCTSMAPRDAVFGIGMFQKLGLLGSVAKACQAAGRHNVPLPRRDQHSAEIRNKQRCHPIFHRA